MNNDDLTDAGVFTPKEGDTSKEAKKEASGSKTPASSKDNRLKVKDLYPANGLPLTPFYRGLPIGGTIMGFAAGLYIVSGKTGGGKTVNSTAIVRAAQDQEKIIAAEKGYKIPAQFTATRQTEITLDHGSGKSLIIDAFEARSPIRSDEKPRRFSDPQEYISDLKKELNDNKILADTATTQRIPYIIVLDSITLPVLAGAKIDIKGSLLPGTLKGGMTWPSLSFIVQLQALAQEYNVVLLAIINQTLVSFSENFEAIAEGSIVMNGVGNLTKRDRIDRNSASFDFTPEAMRAVSDLYAVKVDPDSLTMASLASA